jgi:hypothetical protein
MIKAKKIGLTVSMEVSGADISCIQLEPSPSDGNLYEGMADLLELQGENYLRSLHYLPNPHKILAEWLEADGWEILEIKEDPNEDPPGDIVY